MADAPHGRRRVCARLVLVHSCALLLALASTAAARAAPDPAQGWTPTERWVWSRIIQGQPADLSEMPGQPPGQAKLPAPNSMPDSQRAARRISAGFLRAVLMRDPWRGAVVAGGVKISGAWFDEHIDLTSAETGHELWLEDSWFDQNLDADYMRAGRSLSLEGSVLPEAFFSFAQVDGPLVLSRSLISKRLVMNGILVGGSLVFDTGQFQDVEMVMAEVGGGVSMDGQPRFAGVLNMSNAKVSGHMHLNTSRLHEANLENVQVGGQLDLCSARFDGPSLNLRGAQVAAVISGCLDDWPPRLNLNRFTYSYIDCPERESGATAPAPAGKGRFRWQAAELIQWLDRQPAYARQPYEQAAKALRESGQPLEASRVIYAGKVRAMGEAWQEGEWPRAAWQAALMLLIGFGEGYYQLIAAVWVGLLVLACYALVRGQARRQGQARAQGQGAVASLLDDMLLSVDLIVPFLKIRDRPAEVNLPSPQRHYLALIRLASLALASFILAGLAGLTK